MTDALARSGIAQEAVIFYESGRMQRCMQWPEFEAVLDRYIPMQDLASASADLVYARHKGDQWSCVLFRLSFDAEGLADKRWNLPLQRLAEQAPSQAVGGAMLRLMQASECRVSAIRGQLWDLPADRSPDALLEALNALFQRNDLGFGRPANAKAEYEQNISEADVAAGVAPGERRDLQLELADLKAALRAYKSSAEKERAGLLRERDALSRHWQEKNALLREQVRQLESQLLNQSAQSSDGDLPDLLVTQKRRFQHDLVHLRDQLRELRRDRESLKQELDDLRLAGDSALLQQLMDAGVSFVVCHPGVEDLLLPLSEAQSYLQDPLAYIAAHCGVAKVHYETWLEHWRLPVCGAVNEAGDRCAKPVQPVSDPAKFKAGQSDRCEAHQAASASVGH